MSKPRINDRELIRLIDKEKLSQTATAKKMGVSRQAVSQRLQELRGKTTKVVVAKKVKQVVEQKLDAVQQLNKINDYANELLDLLMRWNRGEDEALQILESQVKLVKVGSGEQVEWIKEFRMKDPRQLALQAMGEIRSQLKLQLEIFQTLYDLQAVQDFQEEILSAINEVAPEVRNAIIHKLNEKRSIRSVVKYD